MGIVTDPALLAQLETTQNQINRGDGGGGGDLSGVEKKELAAARDKVAAGREYFPLLAQQYRAAETYPGGIPRALYDKTLTKVGSQDPLVQNFDRFNALTKNAASSKARLLSPVSEYDVKFLMEGGANPTYRLPTNQMLLGLDFKKASMAYFESEFRQRFAANNGSLNVKDKQGRSYAQALAEAYKRPEVQNLMTPPWARKQAAAPARSQARPQARPQARGPALPKGVNVEEVPD